MVTTELKNKVVEYHGGGMDGCIFEYNFAYFDCFGDFHDLYSSGSMGITDEDSLREKMEEEPNDIEIYDVDTKEGRSKLSDEVSVRNALRLSEALEEHGIKLYVKCDCCDNSNYTAEDCEQIDQELVCCDCRGIYTCDACGEFDSTESYDEETGYRCSCCIKNGKK
jgi:hypothetical protein